MKRFAKQEGIALDVPWAELGAAEQDSRFGSFTSFPYPGVSGSPQTDPEAAEVHHRLVGFAVLV